MARHRGDAARWEALTRALAPALAGLRDFNLVSGIHCDLGECERRAGRLDAAAAQYRLSARHSRYRAMSEIAYANLALVQVERGDWAGAEAIVLEARWAPIRRTHRYLAAVFAELQGLLAAHAGDLAAFDEAWDELEELLGGLQLVDGDFAEVAERAAAELEAVGAPDRAARARALAAAHRSQAGVSPAPDSQ